MDDNYLIIGEMGRDKLGDLSQFDGHTPGSWEAIKRGEFYLIASRIQSYAKWPVAVEILERDASLIAAAPDLLAALKESRKENEELRERISKAKEYLLGLAYDDPGLLRAVNILEGKHRGRKNLRSSKITWPLL